jgi:Fic family protein
MPLNADIVMKLSEADAALGRLAGSGRLLPYPHLLVSAYVTREAVSSSRIEGTQASVTEVFDAAVTQCRVEGRFRAGGRSAAARRAPARSGYEA